MKRSLLLISLLAITCFTVQGQQMVKQKATPGTEKKAAVKKSSAAPKSQKKQVAKKKVKTKKKVKVIKHPAPDQRKIDSIKKEKAKYKH